MTSNTTTSRAFTPRRFAWRGRVPVRAVFFARDVDDGPARALTLWRSGARLRSLDGGLLLVLPVDVHIDARSAPGEVFVDVDGVLSSCPLRPLEREQLARGDVVRARGGRAVVVASSALADVPAGALVDVSLFRVAEVTSLGVPPPVVIAVEEAAPVVNARVRLLRDDAPNPERDSVARALRGEPSPADVADAEQSALRRAQQRAAQGMPAQGAGESVLRAVVKALEATGLMDKLKAAQRKYVEETLDLLKHGSIEDALKRAVPLARPGTPTAPRPSIALPSSRTGLNINMGPRTPSSSSITVEDDLFARMRASYRDAAKKLAADKRYREAAFVYIELLGEPREGIAVLEQSGDRELLRLAAEVALANDVGHAVAVRLFMRARDVDRAVALARRHRAFATAVVELERSSDRDSAALLRSEWAAHLARTGQYAAAVEVVWPGVASSSTTDPPLGLLADLERLLDVGIQAGGVDLPTLVARRMTLDARRAQGARATKGAVREPRDLERFSALVDDDAPGAAVARAQLAYALGDASASLRSTTSSLFRAICADAAAGSELNLKVLGERLADAALRADLPTQPPRPLRRAPAEVLVLTGAPGAGDVVDAALLPDGRLLVALGEAGAAVITRKGGVASRSSEPCQRIVVHDAGSRALLVAQRGDVMRIARYDTARGASSHWLDVRAHAIADSTDGDLVFLARNDEVIAIDALADVVRVLWQTRLPAPALNVARDVTTLAVTWIAADARVATFDGRSLARRDEWPLPPMQGYAGDDIAALNSAGDVVRVDWPQQAQVTPPGPFQLLTPPGSNPTSVLTLGRDLAAIAFEGDEENGVVAHARGSDRLVMIVDGGAPKALRAHEHVLVIIDDRGRAFVVDTRRGTVLQRLTLP